MFKSESQENTVKSEGTQASLDFCAAARQSVIQEIPIVNDTEESWRIDACVTGQYYSGPQSIRIDSKSTGRLAVSYCVKYFLVAQFIRVLSTKVLPTLDARFVRWILYFIESFDW